MCCLAEGPTPSQPTFPTGRTPVFVLFQTEKSVRLMIGLLLAMGAHCWVTIFLCLPSAAPFLEAVALSLDILIVVY